MIAGIVQAVDHRLVGVLGAVEDEPGRIDARPQHQSGLHHLRLGKDGLRAGGRVERAGDAVGQVGVVAPLALRVDVEGGVAHVGVHVHQPRDDRLAAHIDDAGAARDLHPARRADRDDPRPFDDDRAVRDHLVAAHRDQAGAGQRHRAAGARLRHRERDLEGISSEDRVGLGLFLRLARRFLLAFFFLGVDRVERMTEDGRTQRVAHAAAVARPVDPVAAVTRQRLHRHAGGARLDLQWVGARQRQRRHVHVVQLLEGDPLAVRRRDDLFRALVLHQVALVGPVQLDAGQVRLPFIALLIEQPRAVGAPARPRHPAVGAPVCRGGHQLRGAALGGHRMDLQVQLRSEVLPAIGSSASAHEGDATAVR